MNEGLNEVNDVLGFGKIFKVLTGKDDDGKPIITEYHITPVAIKDLPKLFEVFDKYMLICGDPKENYGEKEASIMLQMGLKKMHPEITEESVKEIFGLMAIAEAIDVIVELNDFFTKVQKINKKVQMMVDEMEENNSVNKKQG